MLAKVRGGRSSLTTEFWRLVATEHRNVAAAALAARQDIKQPSTWYSRGAVDHRKPTMKGAWRQAPNVFRVPDSGITPLSKASPHSTIGFLDRENGGENISAEIAAAFAARFKRLAPVGKTGRYKSSLFYILNKRRRELPTILRYAQTNPLNSRETIIISSNAAEYAAAIESAAIVRGEAGIFRRIALELIAEYGARASIKFTYLNNHALGVQYDPRPNWTAQGAIMLPVLLVGGPGQFPSSATTNAGKKRRKRLRASARTKLKRKGLLS